MMISHQMPKFTVLVIALLCFATPSWAQKQANIFSLSNYELDFATGAPVLKSGLGLISTLSKGMICDENGALLFYTDGFSVWNKNHQLMPNGTDLLPATSVTKLQKSIVVPKPGSATIYYIFTTDPYNGQTTSGLYYSVVDISLAGGLGDVVTKGVRLIVKTNDELSAVLHENGKDIWVMTHQHNSDLFYALLVTDAGPSASVFQQHIGPTIGLSLGQMKFSPDGKKLALTYPIDNRQDMMIADFDAATGVLTNQMLFSLQDISGGMIGPEFSSDGTRVYVEGPYTVYQYDVSLPTYDDIQNSRTAVKTGTIYNVMYSLQLGLDGRIYATKGGGGSTADYLAVIDNPNAPANDVLFKEKGLYLNGASCFAVFMPSLIQSYLYKTSFVAEGHCQNAPITFHITNLHQVESAEWSFGNGVTSDALQPPPITYTKEGTYTVKLTVYYKGKSTTISQDITVKAQTPFDLGTDRMVCPDYKLVADDGFAAYQWSTTETSKSIEIKISGKYKLTATNPDGCISKDSVQINVASLPAINLADTIPLAGGSALLDPGTFTHQVWSTGESTPTITVTHAGWYSVLVGNDFGCQATKSVYVDDGVRLSDTNSPWTWLNPLPTGATGLDIQFANEKVGFITNSSGLLRTTDAGETWEIYSKKVKGRRMVFKNLIGYVVGDGGQIYKSTHLGVGWNALKINTTENLNSITVVSDDTLRVTSDKTLFASNDGGKTWVSHPVPTNANEYYTVTVKDAFFTSGKVGHVACNNGTIKKTKDGGVTWYATLTSNTIPSDFFRIKFADDNVGYATREHSYVFKTTNAGETWTQLTASLDAAYALQFISPTVGFIGGDDGAMHKTTDGGATWQWIGDSGRIYAYDIYGIFFLDLDRGFATGMRGRILKTVDGGKSWTPYALTYNDITQIDFTSDQTGYAIAGGQLIKTVNKKDWQRINSPISGQRTARFNFLNDNLGFASAGYYANRVMKTTDGGNSWTQVYYNTYLSSDLSTVKFTDENTGFISWGGTITQKTTDGGATWRTVASVGLLDLQFLNANVGYARSTAYYALVSIYKTIDGGETWTISKQQDDNINALHFVDELTGYYVGEQNTVYKTANGGTTWQKLNTAYGDYVDVYFISKDYGYILDDYGILQVTKDGGATWTNIPVPSSYSQSIEVQGTDIYIAGAYGTILTSTISYNDALSLDGVSVTDVTLSGATIHSKIRSYMSLPQTTVTLQIGRAASLYDHTYSLGQYAGVLNQSLVYNLQDLDPDTRYYCRITVSDGTRSISTPETSFKTSTVTAVEETVQDLVSLYPNPASATVTVNVSGASTPFTYQVCSVVGQPLLQGTATGKALIDVSSLKPGLYMVIVGHGGEKTVTRIVKR
ncbi:YCF48-related protein [Chryseolinea soli]|nr:YCF48-related protein [Chryseolinea soli]